MIQTRQITPQPEESQKYAGGVFEKRIVSETIQPNSLKSEENEMNSEDSQFRLSELLKKRIVSEISPENLSKQEENGVNSSDSQFRAGALFENANSLGSGECSKEDLHKLQEVKTLGKIVTVANQVPVCPTCGNKFLAVYHMGAWRCNQCGDTSANY